MIASEEGGGNTYCGIRDKVLATWIFGVVQYIGLSAGREDRMGAGHIRTGHNIPEEPVNDQLVLCLLQTVRVGV